MTPDSSGTVSSGAMRRERLPSASGYRLEGTEAQGLPVIPGGWQLEEFHFQRPGAVGDLNVRLAVPADPDGLLDDPETQSAQRQDDYMPYWAWIWPASLAMSTSVLQSAWPPGCRTLELGCGTGLVGIAALAAGCRVTLTDYDQKSVRLAEFNARLNGHSDFSAMVLDWRQPSNDTWDLILGCDLLYERSHLEPILRFVDQTLSNTGVCWLADGGRPHLATFVTLAESHGFRIKVCGHAGQTLRPGEYHLLEVRRIAAVSL